MAVAGLGTPLHRLSPEAMKTTAPIKGGAGDSTNRAKHEGLVQPLPRHLIGFAALQDARTPTDFVREVRTFAHPLFYRWYLHCIHSSLFRLRLARGWFTPRDSLWSSQFCLFHDVLALCFVSFTLSASEPKYHEDTCPWICPQANSL